MRSTTPTSNRPFARVRLLLLCTAAALAACQNDPLAPESALRPQVLSLHGGSCADVQPSRVLPSSTPPTLGGVRVTASYTGLPWDIMQQMLFPLYYGAERAACFNSPEVSYLAETLYVAEIGEIPAPDGVDAEWWATLSPREQKALLRYAEEMLRLYPDRYSRPSNVINQFFKDSMLRSKVQAKVRAADFFGSGQETELFAGGIYGCTLYQNFIRQADWVLTNKQTLDLVIELVTAFAEAEFVTRPYRSLAFGRNGAIGAAMAAQDAFGNECGQMLFNSIPSGRITVTDPYAPTPPLAPGGRYTPPPPPDSPPLDWRDQ